MSDTDQTRRRPTIEDGRRSLSEHVQTKALEARAIYGPEVDWPALQRMLSDERYVRFPVTVVFDADTLEPGELAFVEQVGASPAEGYRLTVHPSFEHQPALLPLIVAYQLVVVNYGEIATHEEAELFGATLLGLDVEGYYQRLCLAADGLSG